jgi:AcrR family transcriptional regulator
MLSIGNPARSDESADIDKRILLAAESCVKDLGADRVTVAEVARRARVSRPTIYRRWPDVYALMSAMLKERVISTLRELPRDGADRAAIVARVVATVSLLRHDPVVAVFLDTGSELTLSSVSARLGQGRLQLVEVFAGDLREAQAAGSVRAGDARHLAALVLVISHSALQLARAVSSAIDEAALDAELTYALNRFLT